MTDMDHVQWWLFRLGDHLVWSRLQVLPSGTAEMLDSSGEAIRYDSEDSARAALLDAGFRALDGLDEEDALELGLPLQELSPPAGDENTLRTCMVQSLPRQH